MAVIDADTHVDETEATWAGLEGAASQFAPATMGPPLEEIERFTRNIGPLSHLGACQQ